MVDQFETCFPSFLWIVRDFALKLIDKNGDKIEPREYLEKALKEQKGLTDQSKNRNEARNVLRDLFPKRDWFTLVRPVEEEANLQKLQFLNDNELRPEFLDGVKQLQDKIFSQIGPKCFGSSYLTGELFVDLWTSYVDAINQGKVPTIDTAWEYIWAFQCEKQIKILLNSYEVEVAKFLIQPMITMDKANLLNLDVWTKYEQEFKSSCKTFNEGNHYEALQSKLASKFNEILISVKKTQKNSIQEYLNKMCKDIDCKIWKGDIYTSINAYILDLDNEYKKFNNTFPLINIEIKALFWKQKMSKLVRFNKIIIDVQLRKYYPKR
jgi:hypothetical protein